MSEAAPAAEVLVGSDLPTEICPVSAAAVTPHETEGPRGCFATRWVLLQILGARDQPGARY